MKCKNCNGDIVYNNGIWKCSSCGSQYSIPELCGDIDVYICYSEVNESGRRTADSVIAQEIYNLLEQKGIKCFYKRTSLGDFSGNAAISLEEAALYQTKMVLFLGTSTDIFRSLWERYGEIIKTKQIIPICHGIEAKDLPKELNTIQAIKYDQVGASSDLLSAVCRILGRQRESSQSFTDLTQKQQTKKKQIIVSVVIIFVIASIIVVIVIKNSLTGARNPVETMNADASEENKHDTVATVSEKNELYTSGVKYMEEARYADAIDVFAVLGDYRDSQSKLRVCYAKYEGYYQDEKTGIGLQLQNINNNGVLKIQSSVDGKLCTIEQPVNFDGTSCDYSYVDSEGNTGSTNVTLNNSSIILIIQNKQNNSDLYIANAEIVFNIGDKSDQPFSNGISIESLEAFLSKKTTLGDLKRMGYDYQFEQALMDFAKTGYYRIKDTDVVVAAYESDLSKSYNISYGNQINADDCIIYGVKAPAYIVAPDRIGHTVEPYFDGDYLFAPDCDFDENATFHYWHIDLSDGSLSEKERVSIISRDTNILIWSDLTAGNEYYEKILNAFVERLAEVNYLEEFPDSDPRMEIVSDEPGIYVVHITDIYDEGRSRAPEVYYRVYKDDYNIEKVNETGSNNTSVDSSNVSYIIPFSSNKELVEGDLVGLSNDELRIARNEIVARHGRRFQDAELQAYFDSMPWYHGTIEPDDFNLQTMLNEIERDNMEFIRQHEK